MGEERWGVREPFAPAWARHSAAPGRVAVEHQGKKNKKQLGKRLKPLLPLVCRSDWWGTEAGRAERRADCPLSSRTPAPRCPGPAARSRLCSAAASNPVPSKLGHEPLPRLSARPLHAFPRPCRAHGGNSATPWRCREQPPELSQGRKKFLLA